MEHMLTYFDQIYCICMADRPSKQHKLLAKLKSIYPYLVPKVFTAIDTRYLKDKKGNSNHHVGCGLSHRAVIQEAKNMGYERILVFEEDVLFRKNFSFLFEQNIQELKTIEWDVCWLGATTWGHSFPKVFGCETLEVVYGSTCTEGIAYNKSIYDYILESWPDNVNEMIPFCKEHLAIDQWLMWKVQGRRQTGDTTKNQFSHKKAVICSPRICSQPWRLRKVIEKPYHDPKEEFF